MDWTAHSIRSQKVISSYSILYSPSPIAHRWIENVVSTRLISSRREISVGRSVGRSVLLFLRSLGEAFLLIDLLQAPLNPSRSCSPLPPPSLSFFFYSLYVSVVCVEHLAPSERCEPCSPFFFFFFFYFGLCLSIFTPRESTANKQTRRWWGKTTITKFYSFAVAYHFLRSCTDKKCYEFHPTFSPQAPDYSYLWRYHRHCNAIQ